MKRLIVMSFMLLSFYALDAQAAHWYVRSGAGGNGTSWTSAWSNVTNISWSSISPGDTIWIAGGSYGTLTVGKSGNADTDAGRIFVKRATAAAHGSDTGWSAGYDAQVVLTGINWVSLNQGSYVTIDGQVTSGISIQHGAGSFSEVDIQRGVSYVTLRYLDLGGPCTSANPTCAQGGDNRMIDTTAWNGSSYENVDHFLLQYSKLHGGCTLIWAIVQNSTFEYNEFADNDASDWQTNCHPNIMATQDSSNNTFRYNKVYNYADEGIMISPNGGSCGTWYIYGNTWGPGISGTNSRPIESQSGANGPVYFYNNTLNGLTIGINTANGGSWSSGSQNKNNIYWNTDGSGLTASNNLCSGTCSGTGSISGASNPFVNLAGRDYHLTSTVGAKYPKDKGTNLGSPYNVDMDGTVRGADGAWDIGAYEYNGGTVIKRPSAPTQLQVN